RARKQRRQDRPPPRRQQELRADPAGTGAAEEMSDGRPRVVLALAPPAERAIEELLFAPQAPVVPAASVAEADELERLLDAGPIAVLLSPELAGITAGHTARARAAGLRIVGVALDEHDERMLASLGADA